jgi:hypothetical protein
MMRAFAIFPTEEEAGKVAAHPPLTFVLDTNKVL